MNGDIGMSHAFGQNVHGLKSVVFIPGFTYATTTSGEKSDIRAPTDLYAARLKIGTFMNYSSYADVTLTVDEADKLLEIELVVQNHASGNILYMTPTRSLSGSTDHLLYAGILLL